jgi:DNA repair exonuclease SbcCD ATPase subunit
MEDNANTLKKARNRQAHLREYREILGHEVERLERSISAGNVFADLKVTHCPACDQEISAAHEEQGRCYVCKQPLDARATASGVNRIEFELEQIRSEITELNELLNRLEAETAGLQEHQTLLREKINGTQELLRPVRTAAAAILPPELAITNMSIGRLQEKRRQLQRVKAALDRREILAKTIQDIQAEIDKLSGSVTEIASTVDYATLGDRLADGMNTYLNKLNEANKDAWLVGDVSVQLQEKTLRIRVGKSDWQNKLGGTLTLYFLLAYHYALLTLMRFPESHFPGLLLIDFPAEIEGASVADKENFVVEPFIDLLSQEGMENCQMVAAASGFFGLEGAHRVELSKVWKA